ncbi:hypothetical protein B0H12DRAFT_1116783 [Mycena haematopus]|nr:hypothetical protein B0H12DRAFT_1116783 [Mycena haematopus]
MALSFYWSSCRRPFVAWPGGPSTVVASRICVEFLSSSCTIPTAKGPAAPLIPLSYSPRITPASKFPHTEQTKKSLL